MSRDEDRGSSSVELALVAPLLMLLVLGVLQFGLWYHAQHVVIAAAQDAARATAIENADPATGRQRARDLLTAGLGVDAHTATVEVSTGPDTVTVHVTARLRPLIPLLGDLALRADAHAFREQAPKAGQP